jgi:hypothetical protein
MAYAPGFSAWGKLQMIQGLMDSGNVYKMALYNNAPSWLDSAQTTSLAYQATGEATATTGYTAGGIILSTYAAAIYGTTATIDWTVDPVWTVTGTLQADTAVIYNDTTGTKSVLAIFGFTQTSATNSTFTVTLPVAAAGTALIRLA